MHLEVVWFKKQQQHNGDEWDVRQERFYTRFKSITCYAWLQRGRAPLRKCSTAEAFPWVTSELTEVPLSKTPINNDLCCYSIRSYAAIWSKCKPNVYKIIIQWPEKNWHGHPVRQMKERAAKQPSFLGWVDLVWLCEPLDEMRHGWPEHLLILLCEMWTRLLPDIGTGNESWISWLHRRKATKVGHSWGNGWQEQEVMLGQGQEENTHTHTRQDRAKRHQRSPIWLPKGASQGTQTSRLTRQIYLKGNLE